VGAGLPAKAACQPTNRWQMTPIPCGSGLAREGGLTADQSLADVHQSPVEAGLPAKAACQPTNRWQMSTNPLWERAWSGRRSDEGGLSS